MESSTATLTAIGRVAVQQAIGSSCGLLQAAARASTQNGPRTRIHTTWLGW